MLFNKLAAQIAKFASSTTSKPALTGILFRGNKLVATDSYRLVELEYKNPPKAEQFPVPPAGLPSAMEPTEDMLMSADRVAEIAKRLPKSRNLPILEWAAFAGKEKDLATIVTSDLETYTPTTMRLMTDAYPDYEAIKPSPKGLKASVTVNARYLEEICELMKKTGRAGLEDVTIEIYDNMGPVILKNESQDYKTTAMLMPIKV